MTQGNNWLDENFTGYNVVHGAGVPVPQRKVLNFGSGLTVGDDPTNGVTTITGTGSAPLYVSALVTTPPLNPSVQEFYIASAYSTPGDGGGGTFVWNPTDTRADNGGTIIAVTGIAMGRWNRVNPAPDVFNVTHFGADASGVSDSLAAFERAIVAKDAAGGGTIAIPHGLFKCSASWDVGTEPYLIRGAGFGRSSLDVFGGASWPSIVGGSVVSFPSGGGITASTDFVHGVLEHFAILGSGTGSSTGLQSATANNGGYFCAKEIGIFNFSTLFNPGAMENQAFYSLDLAGGNVGIALAGAAIQDTANISGTVDVTNGSSSVTFSTSQTMQKGDTLTFASQPGVQYQLSAAISGTSGTLTANYTGTSNAATAAVHGVWTGWTDLKFYHTQVQYCADAVIGTLGTMAEFFGGLVQANTRGVTLGSTIAGVTTGWDFYGTWFEGQGYPSAPHAGPDLVFDSTYSTPNNYGFHGCRFADNPPFHFVSGSNFVERIVWDRCFMAYDFTIPSNAVEWTFLSPPQVTITNNSATVTLIEGTGVTAPVVTGATNLAGPYVALGGSTAASGAIRTIVGANGAMKIRSSLGAYDVLVAQGDAFDGAYLGDPSHAAFTVIDMKAGGFTTDRFGAVQRYIRNDVQGTPDTQNAQHTDYMAYLKTVGASAGVFSLGYTPPNGHSATIKVEWVARDVTIGDTYSGTTQGCVKKVSGSGSLSGTATSLGAGDSGLSSSTVSVDYATGNTHIVATPPGGYANNIDWLFHVVILEN